jgi:hypothetical protein
MSVSTQPIERPSRGQLVRQFVQGCGYLGVAAAVVAAVSEEIISSFSPEAPNWWSLFPRTLLGIAGGSLLIVLVLLLWLIHASAGINVRRRQFGLVSLLLITALFALLGARSLVGRRHLAKRAATVGLHRHGHDRSLAAFRRINTDALLDEQPGLVRRLAGTETTGAALAATPPQRVNHSSTPARFGINLTVQASE